MATDDNAAKDGSVKDALEKFQTANEGTEWNRTEYYNDTMFARMAEQWPDEIKQQRIQESRPALTVNKLPVYIRSVVNEARMAKPGVQIGPVDNGADEDSAEVISGLIKSIERNSSAEVAYTTALDHAVTGGFGFFEVGIDYAHDDTFELEAKIRRIPNALMVHWDPASTEFDASDWNYAFISEWMSEAEYHQEYPGGAMIDFEGSYSDELTEQWMSDDMIRIAAFWDRTQAKRKLLMLQVTTPDGQVQVENVREDQLPVMAQRFFQAGNMGIDGMSDADLIAGFMELSGVQVIRERMVNYHEVVRRVVNGTEVLKTDPWPGQTIPICPVWGDEVYVDGRRRFRSLIRDAKDSQTMFNFWRSASTELVALAPKAPWVMPVGSVPKGQEENWRTANTRSHPYLEYEPVPGAPPPQRQPFAGVPAGALQESLNSADDIKSTMGIYDASIGARSNETSGKAILARERQGDVTNYHFIDNWARAINYCGKVLLEIIPAVYSAKGSIRILGEDSAEKVVRLTQQAGGAKQKGADGGQALYNLSVGKYDVTVKKGPSFQTQREETRETLIEIMRAVPGSAQYIGDLLMDHMDFQGADKLARRLRHLLPPEIRAVEEAEEKSDDPELAAAQAKINQQNQTIQQGMQHIQQLETQIEQLNKQKQVDAESAKVDAQVKLKTAQQRDVELELKAHELSLKERDQTLKEQQVELTASGAGLDEQIKVVMQREEQQHEATQKDKDRQVELAKAIIAKQGDGKDKVEDDVIAAALQQALEIMGAPKRLIYDPKTGDPVGVEPVVN